MKKNILWFFTAAALLLIPATNSSAQFTTSFFSTTTITSQTTVSTTVLFPLITTVSTTVPFPLITTISTTAGTSTSEVPTTSAFSSTSIGPTTSITFTTSSIFGVILTSIPSTTTGATTTIVAGGTTTAGPTTTAVGNTSSSIFGQTPPVQSTSITTTTIGGLASFECPFSRSAAEKNPVLRNLRDSHLDTVVGALLVAMYYQNIREISVILLEDIELRDRFATLILENLPLANELLQNGRAIMASERQLQLVEFINDLDAQASPRLSQQLDFIRRGIETGWLLWFMGVTVE